MGATSRRSSTLAAAEDTLADWEYGHAAAQINIQAFQQQPGRYEIKTVAASLDPVRTAGGVRTRK